MEKATCSGELLLDAMIELTDLENGATTDLAAVDGLADVLQKSTTVCDDRFFRRLFLERMGHNFHSMNEVHAEIARITRELRSISVFRKGATEEMKSFCRIAHEEVLAATMASLQEGRCRRWLMA